MRRFGSMTLLAACLVLCPAAAAAEEKARKVAPRRERAVASNASVRTQQRTGDAMAAKTARPEGPAKPQGKPPSPEDAGTTLEHIERRLAAEQARFASVMSDLRASEQAAVNSGKAKSVATARKAIDREKTGYERKTAPLLAQRDELCRKLGLEPAQGPQDAGPPREAVAGNAAGTRD